MWKGSPAGNVRDHVANAEHVGANRKTEAKETI
jgi:hypothetical protein